MTLNEAFSYGIEYLECKDENGHFKPVQSFPLTEEEIVELVLTELSPSNIRVEPLRIRTKKMVEYGKKYLEMLPDISFTVYDIERDMLVHDKEYNRPELKFFISSDNKLTVYNTKENFFVEDCEYEFELILK